MELIALAQVEEREVFYGAVTIRNAWNFGRLDAVRAQIEQDITLYRVPDDLKQLTQILIWIVDQRLSGGSGLTAL